MFDQLEREVENFHWNKSVLEGETVKDSRVSAARTGGGEKEEREGNSRFKWGLVRESVERKREEQSEKVIFALHYWRIHAWRGKFSWKERWGKRELLNMTRLGSNIMVMAVYPSLKEICQESDENDLQTDSQTNHEGEWSCASNTFRLQLELHKQTGRKKSERKKIDPQTNSCSRGVVIIVWNTNTTNIASSTLCLTISLLTKSCDSKSVGFFLARAG